MPRHACVLLMFSHEVGGSVFKRIEPSSIKVRQGRIFRTTVVLWSMVKLSVAGRGEFPADGSRFFGRRDMIFWARIKRSPRADDLCRPLATPAGVIFFGDGGAIYRPAIYQTYIIREGFNLQHGFSQVQSYVGLFLVIGLKMCRRYRRWMEFNN